MSELDKFFQLVSEEKKVEVEKSPGKKLLKKLEEDLKQTNPFLHLEVKEPELIEEQPEPEPLVEEQQVLIEVEIPMVAPGDETQTMQDVDKYLRGKSFQQPNPDTVDPNIRAVQDKLKFLEQAIGRIAATGPGSGAAEIYNLDLPTKTVTGDYTIGRKDYYVGVNNSVKTYITLPTSGSNVKNGRVVVIKDESGHAQLTPIKIVGTIDNDPNGAEIRINNGAVQLLYSDGQWRII